MEWIENCNIIIHPKLVHKKNYEVKLESGLKLRAMFWVYKGGDEVAFILPISGEELSVTHFFA